LCKKKKKSEIRYSRRLDEQVKSTLFWSRSEPGRKSKGGRGGGVGGSKMRWEWEWDDIMINRVEIYV